MLQLHSRPSMHNTLINNPGRGGLLIPIPMRYFDSHCFCHLEGYNKEAKQGGADHRSPQEPSVQKTPEHRQKCWFLSVLPNCTASFLPSNS